MTPQRAPFRLLRTAGVAASVTSLAAGAHLFGGGRLPPAPVLAACTALVVLAVVIFTRWKLRAPVLGMVLTGGQVLLHSLFSALSGAAAEASSVPTALSAGHRHSGSGALAATPAASEIHLHLPWEIGPAMLTAHLAATLATALMLAKGEAALWALAAWLRPILFPVPATFVHPAAAPVLNRRQAPIRCRPVGRAHPRRGPPGTA
ncbi:hypothetical protein Asphe3_41100 (plasmid) [Pseudarthrobacter phenanthrenivorans Sphe3]|uniref:Uncharacterized protein n=1 Tax=Pseudarthrobacter phenanthrenivorans (strain DSM 18606 / JCM 16027 / LMG 23796 / Sphe3) TaxID=930171 RepID=F0MCC4_PSEPM|nr:hypothetical protein [Pseudarthrobacter phenanthrenivorans]ADX75175.1 hypothetical protein Asphe3_41100 [Pseudarthrobacter phenanthrenivorans Sphe3]